MPKNSPAYDGEISIHQILDFFVDIRRYWLIGGFGLGILTLVYALAFYPTTVRQIIINDIDLIKPELKIIESMMPSMIKPLELEMREKDLAALYLDIISNDTFLKNAVFGRSGFDGEDENISLYDKNKLDFIEFKLSGDDAEKLSMYISFLADGYLAISEHLSLNNWLDKSINTTSFNIFEIEIKKTKMRIELERLQTLLADLKKLKPAADKIEDIQVILNLNNNNLDENLPGEKYLPLGNRLLAIQSELQELKGDITISDRELKAANFKLSMFEQLKVYFDNLVFNAKVIDFDPFFGKVDEARALVSTKEEVAVIDNITHELLKFDIRSSKFNKRLPLKIEKKGRGRTILIGGILGGFLGILIGTMVRVSQFYRRRNKS